MLINYSHKNFILIFMQSLIDRECGLSHIDEAYNIAGA